MKRALASASFCSVVALGSLAHAQAGEKRAVAVPEEPAPTESGSAEASEVGEGEAKPGADAEENGPEDAATEAEEVTKEAATGEEEPETPVAEGKASAEAPTPGGDSVDEVAGQENDADSPEPSPYPLTAPVATPPESDEFLPTGFIVAPRLGLTGGGWTKFEVDCNEDGLTCGELGVRDHAEASSVGFALDGLYAPIHMLRLGANVQWLPSAKGDGGGELRRLGQELDFHLVAEAAFEVSDSIAVAARVQGGAAVLLPQGFVDDVVETAQDDCDVARDGGIDCTVEDGPYLAPTYGGGVGMIFKTKSSARLRLDLLFQTQRFRIYRQEASLAGIGSLDATVRMHQNRFWLMGGFEI